MKKSLNFELENVNEWFRANMLTLNLDKTNLITFGGKKDKENINIRINNQKIKHVKTTKFLGIIVDHLLSWKEQSLYIQKIISKGIGIMYQLRKFLNSKSLYMLYTTLVLPYLNYCTEIWGNTYITRLKQISTLQKRAIRILGNVGYLENTNKLFAKFNCLKFNDIIKLKTCLFMYKAENKMLPDSLMKRFVKVEHIHDYNTRNKKNFSVKRTKSNLMGCCMSVRGVKVYNSIPNEIKNAKTVKIFTNKIKKYLVSNY